MCGIFNEKIWSGLKKCGLVCWFLWSCLLVYAQSGVYENYRRSSLYSVMLNTGDKYCNEIEDVFTTLPVNDKFNNHDLSVKSIKDYDGSAKDKRGKIERFLVQSQLAKRIVAKWFDRDRVTGAFDMDLVAERGQYNASELDVKLAQSTVRGIALLEDAGEELIGNTFLLVNDIRYVDKEANAQVASLIFSAVKAVATELTNVSNEKIASVASLVDLASGTGKEVSDLIGGFRVTITSYLYRLEWTEAVASEFYEKYYYDSLSVDVHKKKAFDARTDLFKFEFIGKQRVTSDKLVLNGVRNNIQLIRKVLNRALDKSIVKLQHEHEVFRVKSAVYEIKDGEVTVQIGMKEGVDEKSRFEVLECYVDDKQRTTYKRVGIIRPVPGAIWDNRYMAVEEEAVGADFNYTRFKIESGSGFHIGMLVREIR